MRSLFFYRNSKAYFSIPHFLQYMIDVDLMNLLPKAYDDFQRNFKLPGILPGGAHCMMSAVSTRMSKACFTTHSSILNNYFCDCFSQVNLSGRPFMGPNLYITPPGSFTHFHQDGHVRNLIREWYHFLSCIR